MKRIFVLLVTGLGLSPAAFAAHGPDDPVAPGFTIGHPTMTMSDSGTLLTLSILETRASFSLNDRPGAQLNLACGQPNPSGTSLLAVTFNGEVKVVGRTKNCVDTLAHIAASTARFQLNIKLSTDQVERAVPGYEYQIQASAQ